MTVAGTEFLAPARWSRYATRWVECPPHGESQRLLEWLLDFGDRERRHVLYAPSDDLAFFFAAHAAELEPRFYLYQPPVEAMVRALDKRRLMEACREAGLEVPPTWFPEDEDDVRRIAREAAFPMLVKARTQVHRVHQTKGIVAEKPGDLLPAYRAFLATHRYRPGLERHFGKVAQPMIQRYLPDAAERVYSITGFVDRSGALHASRSAIKVFQRTRPVGLGLCFEAAPEQPALVDAVLQLCRTLGHCGVFEVEFVQAQGRSMVIDFNPRFYGQMGFETARGLPLALLAYYAAVDEVGSLQACVARAQRSSGGATIYTHRFVFELLLAAQRFGRGPSAEQAARWRRWFEQHRGHAADVAADAHDWAPGVVQAAAELLPGFRVLRRLVESRVVPRRASSVA